MTTKGAGRGLRERLPNPGLSTRRAAVLALVVCALALTLAVPLRTYVSQRQQLAETASTQTSLAAQVAGLQNQLTQLEDPAYVAAQARQRLQYVLPGQTPYDVALPAAKAADAKAAADAAKAAGPWYSRLWSSVRSGG